MASLFITVGPKFEARLTKVAERNGLTKECALELLIWEADNTQRLLRPFPISGVAPSPLPPVPGAPFIGQSIITLGKLEMSDRLRRALSTVPWKEECVRKGMDVTMGDLATLKLTTLKKLRQFGPSALAEWNAVRRLYGYSAASY